MTESAMDKQSLREIIWTRMMEEGVTCFPGAVGRIPNFKGALAAAERLSALPEWESARIVKANPDSPQRPVRRLALEQGKTLLMAVPRLTRRECFILLDPAKLPVSPYAASSIRGASRYGLPVSPEALPDIDLIVMGSVAVSRRGERVGKGGGYADLEYALLRRFGKVSPSTPVVTTVHPIQVVERAVPMMEHDVPVSHFSVPDEIQPSRGRAGAPEGVYWDRLSPEKIASIPILQELAETDRPSSA